MRIWIIFTLFFIFAMSCFPWTSPVFADEAIVSVKLVNYIGRIHEVQIAVKGQIRIKESPETLLSEGETYTISNQNGNIVLSNTTGMLLSFKQSVTLTPYSYNSNNQIIINNRPYLGDIKFTLENDILRPINSLPLEDYLKGVIPFEMPASWASEALKAQAIAARTYTMTQKDKLIDDTTKYQVYGGFKWFTNSSKAVDDTRGQVLVDPNGSFIQAVYSSSNGGVMESSQNVWGDKSLFPYLSSRGDAYDPKLPWTLSFMRDQILTNALDLVNPDTWWDQTKEADETISKNIKSWLQKNGFNGKEIKIKSIPNLAFSPDKTTGNRTVKGSISIEFFVKEAQGYQMENGLLKTYRIDYVDIPVDRIRALLDPTTFKSSFIDTLDFDTQRYKIRGYGFGHGVGMSQYGAKAMAQLGKKVEDILAYYYPGTQLKPSTGSLVDTNIIKNTEIGPKVPSPSHTKSPDPLISRTGTAYFTGIDVKVNGKSVPFPDQQPYIETTNHRTMVPLRFVAESLGAHVDWDSRNQLVTMKKKLKTVSFRIGDKKATINGDMQSLDSQAVVKENRTFVPLRFITESFNGTVKWDPQTKTVSLSLQP